MLAGIDEVIELCPFLLRCVSRQIARMSQRVARNARPMTGSAIFGGTGDPKSRMSLIRATLAEDFTVN